MVRKEGLENLIRSRRISERWDRMKECVIYPMNFSECMADKGLGCTVSRQMLLRCIRDRNMPRDILSLSASVRIWTLRLSFSLFWWWWLRRLWINEILIWPFAWIWFSWTNMRYGETYTLGQKWLPRGSKRIETVEIWQTWLTRAVGWLVCQGQSWLYHPDWLCTLPPVWPSRSRRSLPIPPLGLRSWKRSVTSFLFDLTSMRDPTGVGTPDGFGSLWEVSPLPWQGMTLYILHLISDRIPNVPFWFIILISWQ